jgi:hypothetical protein
LKKEFNILKKPYLPPRVEFEEIETDEREMLLAGSDTTGGGSHQGTDPSGPNPSTDPGEEEFEGSSLDLDFVMNT